MVTLNFVGAPPYVEGDSCSQDYVGAAEVVGTQLQVSVVPKKQPVRRPTSGPVEVSCTHMGHRRSVDVVLDVPFEGTEVVDLWTGPEKNEPSVTFES